MSDTNEVLLPSFVGGNLRAHLHPRKSGVQESELSPDIREGESGH